MKILKGLIVLIALILTIPFSAQAVIYVALDKESGEVKGMVDISPDSVGDWAKTYVMKEADESYRGKQGYEMKYVNQKLRMATEKEITDYKKEIDDKAKIDSRKNALEAIGISEKDIEKLKKLPEGA